LRIYLERQADAAANETVLIKERLARKFEHE